MSGEGDTRETGEMEVDGGKGRLRKERRVIRMINETE